MVEAEKGDSRGWIVAGAENLVMAQSCHGGDGQKKKLRPLAEIRGCYAGGEGIVVAERKSVDHDWNQWGCCKMERKIHCRGQQFGANFGAIQGLISG